MRHCMLLLAACVSSAESHGTTAKQYSGVISVTFINATPERLCGLYLSFENEPEYGDNWLPRDGLPVGSSVELKVKPGTYKAKWNTCKDARDRPTISYAATLVGGTAFLIEEPLQLYAFVSDGTPPTKRGVPKPKLKMIKFIGQQTEIAAAPPPGPEPQPAPTEPAPTEPAPSEPQPATGFIAPLIWVVPPPAPVVAAPRPAPVAPVAPAPAPRPPPPVAAPAPPVAAPPPPPPPPPPAAPPLGPPGSTIFKPK